MNNAVSFVNKYLTSSLKSLLGRGASPNGAADRSEDVFQRYLLLSLIIHVIVIAVLSVSYRRAIRPDVPMGPYEVSLIELEKPKPQTTSRKKPVRPKPKPPEQKKVVIPEPKKEEEAVKIKPEVKKEEEEPEEKPKEPEKKPETKKPEPAKTPPKESEPDSVFSNRPEPNPTPTVGGMQIDSPNFKFDYYLAMLQMKIQNNWNVPKGLPVKQEGIIATVKFTVRRDGTITRVDVEQTSGLMFFDQSALRAVVNSNPAPPLPRAFNEDRLGVHVNFVFKEEL